MLANVFDITSCFRLSLPCGGRRDVFASRLNVWRFQSTPSVGRATSRQQDTHHTKRISIHALRGEGDEAIVQKFRNCDISIHALRGEGDKVPMFPPIRYSDFNPRPPWGGRHRTDTSSYYEYHFNPRPPCGGRHLRLSYVGLDKKISIHALRVEGDYLTLYYLETFKKISIHALRVEGDPVRSCRK